MSTITRGFTKEQLIAAACSRIDFARQMLRGNPLPLAKRKWEIELSISEIALASLEANGTLANEGTITATQFKPVADLYEVTVPSGRSTTFTKDAAEASDCRVMGWTVQEYVKLERYQAAMLQGADGNSPVIPDGYALVPIEPTEDMIVNGFESEPDESFSDEKEWEVYEAMSGCQQAAHRAKLCWAAMISAAPKI